MQSAEHQNNPVQQNPERLGLIQKAAILGIATAAALGVNAESRSQDHVTPSPEVVSAPAAETTSTTLVEEVPPAPEPVPTYIPVETMPTTPTTKPAAEVAKVTVTTKPVPRTQPTLNPPVIPPTPTRPTTTRPAPRATSTTSTTRPALTTTSTSTTAN